MFVSCLDEARRQHEKWLDVMPEEQAGLERTFIMGTVNHVLKSPDTITAHMHVDLLEAVPRFLKEKMTRMGTHQVQAILFYTLKTLLPSAEYTRIGIPGIARDIMRPPRSGYPRDFTQAITWLEEFFNTYVVAASVHAMMEPKEIRAFVIGNVKHCTAQDPKMSMVWIDLKKRYEVTLKTFSHDKLESLLRELIVQMRLRVSDVTTFRCDSRTPT
eukprot:2130294-Amphidinium_carterae.2